jgi:lipopolysaccharide export system protein LptA
VRAAAGGLVAVVAAALTWTASVAGAQAPTRPAPKPAAPSAAPAPPRPAGEKAKPPVTVDADRMERFGKESLIVFIGNVVARQDGSVQYADRMEVYLDDRGDRILRTVSTGNVRIVTKDCRTGTARRAEFFELEQRVVLMGGARVWQDDNVVSGDTITIYTAQDRSVVEGGKQERVKAVFYQQKDRDEKDAKDTPTRTASGDSDRRSGDSDRRSGGAAACAN